MRIDQWVPALHRGDAIGDSARLMRDAFRSWGHTADVYALELDADLAGDGRDFAEWRPDSATDVVILHYALPSPLTPALKAHRGRRVLLHHNITPPEFFADDDPEMVRICALGEQELATLAGHVDLGLADSEFNRRELEALGFRRTGVLPIYLDFAPLPRGSKPRAARSARGRPHQPALRGPAGSEQAPGRPDPPGLSYWKRFIASDVRLLLVGKLPRRRPLLRRPAGLCLRGGLHALRGGLHRPRRPRRPPGLLRGGRPLRLHERARGLRRPPRRVDAHARAGARLLRHRRARHPRRRGRAVHREAPRRGGRAGPPPRHRRGLREPSSPARIAASPRSPPPPWSRPCAATWSRCERAPADRVRGPALRRGRHRGLRVAGPRRGRAPGRVLRRHRLHDLRPRLRDLAQRAAGRGGDASRASGCGASRSRRSATSPPSTRSRSRSTAGATPARRSWLFLRRQGPVRAAARGGARRGARALRGGRLLHLPLLPDLLGAQGRPRAVGARSHHPRRAAAALRDLPRGVRAAPGLRLPAPGPRRRSSARASRSAIGQPSVVGMGVEVVREARRRGLPHPPRHRPARTPLYAGRIDAGKGCARDARPLRALPPRSSGRRPT